MDSGKEQVHEKIKSFNQRYYLNLFIKGLILSLSILAGYFLLAAVLEHNLWLGSWVRLLLFLSFFIIVFYCTFRFLKEPLQWWLIKKGLNEEQSAKLIGTSLPAVSDRLLNFIQLSSLKNNSLAFASLKQKAVAFESLSFEDVVDLNENKKYLKFLAIPIVLILLILVINSSIITQSTVRLVNFNKEFSPEAPFQFLIQNKSLTAFYNEDFKLQLTLKGHALPADVYLNTKNQRYKIEKIANGVFEFTFENIRDEFDFQLEAAGFYSDRYNVTVNNRPELSQFKIELSYPRYLQRKNEQLINAGNLEIPEGTEVTWKVSTMYTETASITFYSDSIRDNFQTTDNQHYTYSKQFENPDLYVINLQNEFSDNKDKISYNIAVIKDQYPTVSVTI